MSVSPTPSVLLGGVFDDLDSLAYTLSLRLGGNDSRLSGGLGSTESPRPKPDDDKAASHPTSSVGSLEAALNRIGNCSHSGDSTLSPETNALFATPENVALPNATQLRGPVTFNLSRSRSEVSPTKHYREDTAKPKSSFLMSAEMSIDGGAEMELFGPATLTPAPHPPHTTRPISGRPVVEPLSARQCASPAPNAPDDAFSPVLRGGAGSEADTSLARAELAVEYDQLDPLDVSLLRDSFVTFSMRSPQALSLFASPPSAVDRDASLPLYLGSGRRQSEGATSSSSRSGYKRFGGTVALASVLEKHLGPEEMSFNLSMSAPRRPRSTGSMRSFSLSESVPGTARGPPLSMERPDITSPQQCVVSPPMTPTPPSYIGSSDVIRTRRRYKPDVVPVSLEPLRYALESGVIERPERVWYADYNKSGEVGDGGGSQRVIEYAVATPPLTPQRNPVAPDDQQHNPRRSSRFDELEVIPTSNSAVGPLGEEDPNMPTPVQYCIFQGRKISVRERDRRVQDEAERKRRLRDAAAQYLSTERQHPQLERLPDAPRVEVRPEPPLRPTFILPPDHRPRGSLAPLRARPSSCN